MLGGSNHAEAEQIITQRKKAFSKAEKDYRKEQARNDTHTEKKQTRKQTNKQTINPKCSLRLTH